MVDLEVRITQQMNRLDLDVGVLIAPTRGTMYTSGRRVAQPCANVFDVQNAVCLVLFCYVRRLSLWAYVHEHYPPVSAILAPSPLSCCNGYRTWYGRLSFLAP
jgi:hypothetical protein